MRILLLASLIAGSLVAETHRFEPKEFYNTFSGTIKPVLTIKPGDHVVTSTIDARGTDAKGVKRGQGPNPQTGPFFIQGAEPGDTLVVHLLKLEPNRTTGYSGTLLAPYTSDPAFLRSEGLPMEPKGVTWLIDKAKGHCLYRVRRFQARTHRSYRYGPCSVASALRPREKPRFLLQIPTTSAATWTTRA